METPRRTRHPLGLRSRVTLFFSIAGLLLSTALATVTYLVARDYLIEQRIDIAKQQTFNNARAIRDQLRNPRINVSSVVRGIRTEQDGRAVLVQPIPNSSDVESYARPQIGDLFQSGEIPETLLTHVFGTSPDTGQPGLQRTTIDDHRSIVVGLPIPESQSYYFESFPLDDVNRSLSFIGTALALGAFGTTIFGALVGWWASRRLLRPLARVSEAAGEIASGGLDTRLPEERDPTLSRLARSFNDMADTVQARIQRETRFASDVSHELRSPITALTAAVEVLDARRADLPDRSQQALDVVVNQVRRFDQMVLDLLELSRLDAGVTEVRAEEVEMPDLVRRIAQRYGFGSVPIHSEPGSERPIAVDRRRMERIVANLLDNARQHGGGPVGIRLVPIIEGHSRWLHLAVEDAGPGVPSAERDRIFERFARGSASRSRIGTGLGLALVAEHAASHGGRAWVEDRPGGGSRFVIALPWGQR